MAAFETAVSPNGAKRTAQHLSLHRTTGYPEPLEGSKLEFIYHTAWPSLKGNIVLSRCEQSTIDDMQYPRDTPGLVGH